MFQSYALFPHMTVARNVGYALEVIVAGEDVPTVKPPGQICRAIDAAQLMALFA